MAHYFLKLNGPRPDFAFTMSDAERATMQQHVQFWRGLQDKGTVLVFGPVLDPAGPFGIGIVEMDSSEAVRAAFDQDPVILSGLGFRYEVHPMNAVTRGTQN